MKHRPDFETFSRLAEQGDLVPIYRQLTGDTLTPVSAFGKIDTGPCSFLFESVVGGERVGRFSFLGADPFLQFAAYENEVVLTTGVEVRRYSVDDPLKELERQLGPFRSVDLAELPRFCGGAVGYAGYDVVRYSERLPHAPQDDRGLPDLFFAFYDRMVVFDHINKTIAVVAMARTRKSDIADAKDAPASKSLAASYDDACRRVDELVEQLEQEGAELKLSDLDVESNPTRGFRSNFAQDDFEAAVEKCKAYIRAGDIFQVVISQRLELETTARPLDIYRALRVVNPSPFLFYLRTPETFLVGSSPEIMVRVEDGVVTNRPLAGTRPRGRGEDEDRRLAEELLADPKERAEHIMLVDLARNDVGRVAAYNTVTLSDVMAIERYSHVMHITSNVTGRLAPGKTAFDALRACVPAGTVSGAPKVRAMQIIDELEPLRRGPYAGAVGYIDFTGNMDTCIALRTLVLKGKTAYLQAGAGIVADSVPSREYEETLNKAKGLLKAIEVAEKQL
jgi:anthranilate synthase component 1